MAATVSFNDFTGLWDVHDGDQWLAEHTTREEADEAARVPLTFAERLRITRAHPGYGIVLPIGWRTGHDAAAVYVGGTPRWAGKCTCGWVEPTDGATRAGDAARQHLADVDREAVAS